MAVGRLYELGDLVKSGGPVCVRILYAGHVFRQIQQAVVPVIERGVNDRLVYLPVDMVKAQLPLHKAETVIDGQRPGGKNHTGVLVSP